MAMTTIPNTCERCETAEATSVVFHFGRQSQRIDCCADCHELLLLDGEFEATAVTR
jgi:endonuclease IV